MIVFDIQFLFIIALPLWLLYRILNYFLRSRKRESFHLRKEIWMNCFFLYCLGVIGVTFFPLFIGKDRIMEPFFSVNYIPVVNTLNELKKIQSYRASDYMLKFWIRNIGGNLVLLLPMGIFLPVFKERFRSVKVLAITGFLISLAIEILQLLSVIIGNMGRAFDVDDIILNTISAVIGYGLFCIWRKFVNRFKEKETQIDNFQDVN